MSIDSIEPRDGRLRIVLAVGSLEIGGAEVQAVRLAQRLAARGHHVSIVALIRGGPLEEELLSAGIRYRILDIERLIYRTPRGSIDVRRTLGVAGKLLRLARRFRAEEVDVLHAFLLWPSAICLPMAALARVPVRVSGRHNLGTDVAGRRYPLVERIAGLTSHHVVAVSHAVARAIAAQGVPSRKIRVIYNAVESAPTAHDVGRQPARGAMIANLIHYKGHRDLVAALKLLDDPPKIDCYGDGPERAALEDMIGRAQLDDVMVLHGVVRNASRFYEDAQFAILTSHEEGLGIAVLEAMAAGLPVIATAVGGVVEVIDDGTTGLLAPPGDPVALARAIGRLVSDPELRARLGRRSRHDVSQRFSWEHCVAEHERMYRNARRLKRSSRGKIS